MSTGSQFTLRLLALDQPGAQEIEEHLLLVLVIVRVAGRDLARPVERQPHRLAAAPSSRRCWRRSSRADGPCARIAAFSAGMPKASQPIGCSTLKPARALVARHHVAHRVVAHVAHVDAPRRVGEHLQHVVFRPSGGVGRLLPGGTSPAGRLGVAKMARSAHVCCQRGSASRAL